MISLPSAPARLQRAILEYLFAAYALLRAAAQPGVIVVMPEFTAADLVKLGAAIRLEDLHAGCFFFPRNKLPPRPECRGLIFFPP